MTEYAVPMIASKLRMREEHTKRERVKWFYLVERVCKYSFVGCLSSITTTTICISGLKGGRVTSGQLPRGLIEISVLPKINLRVYS
jgi:hypothetical protein